MDENKGENKRRLRNYRWDVKNEEIKKKREEGWSIAAIMDFYSCSRGLVKRVLSGIRPETPETNKVIEKPCSHCGIRPIGKGKVFLCDYCFSNADNGTIEIHNTYSSQDSDDDEQ